jgi:hypothetical protein
LRADSLERFVRVVMNDKCSRSAETTGNVVAPVEVPVGADVAPPSRRKRKIEAIEEEGPESSNSHCPVESCHQDAQESAAQWLWRWEDPPAYHPRASTRRVTLSTTTPNN